MGGILRAFIVMALLAIPVAAQAQGKIGVVNLDDALGNSSAGKAAFSQLKSRFESREKALASQGEELKRMQNDLQKASVALSADAKKSKAAEFENKARKYFEDQKQLQQEEQQAQQSVLQPLLNRLQKVLTDYASKNGYSVIMEARSVPYFDAKLDMTKAIQQEFDRSK